ncbi:hypothetical protein SAMN04488074_13164 [Lentzea albidocapillata subsp. violacea]|uniref:Uncharacterized protein n=1 Tax=Lentzea albidocapillata subsp. violacea TaxID=128104 RepID=A0A1G9XWW7_9PSEU|nr:hypothetical protein SAMN04488074_13164 [Lentzea albidocapillata subsp. violacea]
MNSGHARSRCRHWDRLKLHVLMDRAATLSAVNLRHRPGCGVEQGRHRTQSGSSGVVGTWRFHAIPRAARDPPADVGSRRATLWPGQRRRSTRRTRDGAAHCSCGGAAKFLRECRCRVRRALRYRRRPSPVNWRRGSDGCRLERTIWCVAARRSSCHQEWLQRSVVEATAGVGAGQMPTRWVLLLSPSQGVTLAVHGGGPVVHMADCGSRHRFVVFPAA